jgi:hypothetical protein
VFKYCKKQDRRFICGITGNVAPVQATEATGREQRSFTKEKICYDGINGTERKGDADGETCVI